MQKLRSVLLLIISISVFTACQKEYSNEDGLGFGTSSGTAIFTLNGTPNECTGAVLNGTYKAGTALDPDDVVVINVNVSNIGTYFISTNSENGMSFAGSGQFAVTGNQTIILKGKGTPAIGGTYSFVPGGDGCAFTVEVEGSGGNAGGTSVFTLNGAPGTCTGVAVNGSYVAGVALTAANKVLITANVTSIGTYTISTTANNGISFSGSGTFTTTGEQPVELIGSGTPAGAGDFNFTPGTNGCLFTITVTSTVVIPDCKTCSYVPTCAGIQYTFQDVNSLGTSERQADILSVKDTSIDGGLYTKITTQGGNSYYNCTAGVTTIVTYNLTGSTLTELKLTMLEATAVAGSKWTDLVLNQAGEEVTYDYTIAEKGISKDVLGVTFADVIHVNVKAYQMGILINESEYYYANGIGLIEVDAKDGTGTTLSTTMLKTYLIP